MNEHGRWARVRHWLPHTVIAALALAAGFMLSESAGKASPDPAPFHDFRVNAPEDYRTLVAPEAPGIAELAERLGTLEAAYLFVRDQIAFDPACVALEPTRILGQRRASCLGKATLLASLYRALGVPAGSVRVVIGQVPYADALMEHAWLDLEYGPVCLQLDATDLFGTHDFLRFTNNAYVEAFVRRELFCFNDRDFAAVSQLNRSRGRHP